VWRNQTFFFFCTISYEAVLQLNHVPLFPFPFFRMLTRRGRPIPPNRQKVFSAYIPSDLVLRFDVVKPEFVQRHTDIITGSVSHSREFYDQGDRAKLSMYIVAHFRTQVSIHAVLIIFLWSHFICNLY
jgi:hypothetical protein